MSGFPSNAMQTSIVPALCLRKLLSLAGMVSQNVPVLDEGFKDYLPVILQMDLLSRLSQRL